MKKQLEHLIKAAQDVLDTPTAEWRKGESSAEWYRRTLARMEAASALCDAVDVALDLIKAEMRAANEQVQSAEAAVLEDARWGDR